ncbi:hypothetical protein [Pseudonocardia parietis]|uniref:Uncharacterized protein n=1 Tax=Pseudonocardia parietis TaxID=570936 RepID=A0ABS4W200_9PSEU|nr:hypothetical protein [Pseudonocardia parietis]MBP2370229.1 hypothetical protein [Pseudonocardia parietis]
MAELVFDEDRNQWVWAAAITDVSGSAGATFTAAEQAIVNDLVAKVNAILAALRAAGKIAND